MIERLITRTSIKGRVGEHFYDYSGKRLQCRYLNDDFSYRVLWLNTIEEVIEKGRFSGRTDPDYVTIENITDSDEIDKILMLKELIL